MPAHAVAFSNNDIAYLWWVYPEKIPGCLGFSVRRIDDEGRETALPALVGFEPGVRGQPHKMRNTDVWPVQAFQWKDVFASPGVYRYKVVPMLGPDPKALVAAEELALVTGETHISGDYGRLQAYFNVGLISTQAMTRQIERLVGTGPGQYQNSRDALLGEIAKAGSAVRQRLAGQVLEDGLLALLTRATAEGGTCKLALYELSDRQLLDAIEIVASSQQLELCLSNADKSVEYVGEDGKRHTKKVFDGTNSASRSELHELGTPLADRFMPSSSIGHNKFVVYSQGGHPQAVLTGSTNWTPTGLCSQTNNALLIEDRDVAEGYRDYWSRLVQDAAEHPVQGERLRAWCSKKTIDSVVDEAHVRVWFSPNTLERTTDRDETPPDLAEVFELILNAKRGVLFLAFNPGSPNCLEVVSKKALEMRDAGKPFFVRGAVTDPSPLGNFATFLTKRDATEPPDVIVTGVAGVPDDFGYWETELYKLGHAVIHDKILVIDPFTPECAVVTGSHNLGYKASYQNDENLVIVKGHRRLAEAYAAHVLDVTNHFAWRSKLAYLYKQGKVERAWGDLDETDAWQDKYFDAAGLASRDAFFFS